MKTGKKVLLGVSGAALLVAGSIAGTLAYLTATETVTNTFTMGKVAIDLTETDVDENGVPIPDAKPVKKNEYRLVPGKTYTKDPTLTVKAESEEAYIRMMLTIENWEAMKQFVDGDHTKLFDAISTDWVENDILSAENDKNLIVEYRYKATVTGDAEKDTVLDPLFEELIIPGALDSTALENLNGFKIVVEGHAIQATGFGSANDAWVAFDAQNATTEASTEATE